MRLRTSHVRRHKDLNGLIAFILLIHFTGCVSPQSHSGDITSSPYGSRPWAFDGHEGVHVAGARFDLYTTVADERLREFLPGFLDATYRHFASILPVPEDHSTKPVAMQTYVLDSRQQWEAFTRTRFPDRYRLYQKISAGGYSEGGTCVVYNIGRAPTLSVIAHEGWHQYLSTYFPESVPAWLNEGLATYCESVEFRRDRPHFIPERNSYRINHLCNALASNGALPLPELLNTDAGQVIEGENVDVTTTYYAQAWALIVYLRHGADGEFAPRFQRMLDDLSDGSLHIQVQATQIASEKPAELSFGEAVFRTYITEDLADFETGYIVFVHQLCW